MNQMAIYPDIGISDGLLIFIILLVIWSAIWKIIALWKSARNKQRIWFVILFVVNTAGILEIIYLKFFQKRK